MPKAAKLILRMPKGDSSTHVKDQTSHVKMHVHGSRDLRESASNSICLSAAPTGPFG
jgi:hypothetical protein